MKQVVVVGAGNWGKNLVKNFHELNALAGVAEMSSDLRQAVANSYPDLQVYADYRDVLNTDISAIVIATPAPTHYSLAKAALAAGKDVFIEKPMTLNTQDAIALAKYADQHDLILMVGHLLLYQPAIAWMRDYLSTGKAGKVLHVMAQRAKLGRVRAEENVWWSFAPHDVSVVLDLLGNPTLKSIQASGHAILQPDVEDNVHVDLVFENGQTAHIHASWYHPLLQRCTTILAEQQMLVYDEVTQQVTVYEKSIDTNLQNTDTGSWLANVATTQPLKLECEHFLECLKTRQQPRSNGWNGVAVVDILEKAQEAMRG
ncbi:Gfo/Idh/MocA family protein [Acaryochloris marina]|uniref:Oxidoreductase domain protein n=1 Tax=Acaryochloris marina (strain MBIC 11017) TaxID=329726 RepID=B0C3B5_ACAM1|nr:Gfo/Idh/MocA family oxidoreductase [Acaryochloris marina]ABW28614.1 oxidoreductase domain protein [Acaryochloris marina MBIC11017]BDM77613.1 oxidoreductase [Acaryochloris marina MBIC10699]